MQEDEAILATDTASRLAMAREYFVRTDAGRADTIDLFTSDVEFYFPKFGVRRGREAFGQLATGLLSVLASLQHNLSHFTFSAAGQTVFVEGLTYGATRAGKRWEGGTTPGGRFCSVFDFRDGKISRMYIYLDPDYVGEDVDRFLWSDEGRTSW